MEFNRPAETQVREHHVVTAGLECRSDILHPEWFDAEEGTKTEALVARNRAQQENPHAASGDWEK